MNYHVFIYALVNLFPLLFLDFRCIIKKKKDKEKSIDPQEKSLEFREFIKMEYRESSANYPCVHDI